MTKVLFNFYDVSNYMLYIQRFSLLILLFFSIYLIRKSYRNIKYPSNSGTCSKNKKDIKGSLLL